MADIVPAIIPRSFDHLTTEVSKVRDFVQFVQVDIADGVFTTHKTWPYIGDAGEFEQLSVEEIGLPFWEDLDYEFHLMIEKPEKTVEDWIGVGASSLVVHAEATQDMPGIIEMCKAAEVEIGVALKASTDIAMIDSYAKDLDFVQCMGSDDLGHHGAAL